MKPQQQQKLKNFVEHYNETARKDGSDLRMILTDDAVRPFVLVNLLENATLPDVPLRERLRIYQEED